MSTPSTHYLRIPVTGPPTTIDATDTSTTDRLTMTQAAVGGYIEPVAGILDGQDFVMYVNEEGKIAGLLHNPRADALVTLGMSGDYIVGPVVLTGPPDEHGNDQGLPKDLIDTLTDDQFWARHGLA